ncbi:MAG TPA: ABC transporter substrate-binding protein [Candidatus Limnocylindria bacterium]|nr:ABC transporter substrate-binding protein [Candidatus Limnocylindria bacterium]
MPTATTGASAAPGEIVFPKPEKTSVKIGLSGVATIGLLPQLVAKGLNLYKKYGLDVEFLSFSGAAQATQALVAGQVDVGDNSGGPVVASLATASPQQLVFITRHNLTDNMYGRKDIRSAADLKGKNVAISSFGSQSHAGALLALKSLGLTDKDVTIQPVGNDSARLAALKAGSVAASMQDSAIAQELTPLGFNILVELTKVQGIGGVPRTSLVVYPEFAEKYPNTVLAMVAAYLEGITEMRRQPDRAAEFLAKDAQLPLEQAKKQVEVELAAPWEPRDGRCDPVVMEFTRQVNLPSNPALANVDAAKACNNKFLDQLKAMGFQKKIGVPGY